MTQLAKQQISLLAAFAPLIAGCLAAAIIYILTAKGLISLCVLVCFAIQTPLFLRFRRSTVSNLQDKPAPLASQITWGSFVPRPKDLTCGVARSSSRTRRANKTNKEKKDPRNLFFD